MPGNADVDMLILITGKLHAVGEDSQVIGQVLPDAPFGKMACLTGNKHFVGFTAVAEFTALSLTCEALYSLPNGSPSCS